VLGLQSDLMRDSQASTPRIPDFSSYFEVQNASAFFLLHTSQIKKAGKLTLPAFCYWLAKLDEYRTFVLQKLDFNYKEIKDLFAV
jgi:hypothetical protein